MTTAIRPIAADEFPTFLRTGFAAFGERVSDEELAAEQRLFEAGRGFACTDGDRIVATIQGASFTITLPGLTTVAAGGVTNVGVLPTYRRRGLLRALMKQTLDDMRARAEAVAILQASESTIYGRFGFGAATFATTLEIDRRHATFASDATEHGSIALVEDDRAPAMLAEVYDRARRQQPGALDRSAARWQALLRVGPAGSESAGPPFVVAYHSPSGQVDGVARYRIRHRWDDGLPDNTVRIRELIATTPEAYTALWRYCLSIDLTTTVQARDRPLDEPLRWQLTDPRRLRVTRLTDDLWLRLLDVSAALAARRYAVAGRIVLEITDPFLPDNTGRYALDGSPDGATCRRTDAEPDLTLDVADLGAAYLGGVRFGTLLRAGRVIEHRDGAARRADALFLSDPSPWCGTPF